MSCTNAYAERGFSLVELLVAAVVALVLVGAVPVLVNPAVQTAGAQADAIDAGQRARVAAAALYRDFYRAGAGLDGGVRAGPLGRYLPPILPRRIGANGGDAPDVVRPDVVSLIWVPEGAVYSELSAAISGTTATIEPDAAGCLPGHASCGFKPGAGVIIFDSAGSYDLFTVLSAQGPDLELRERGPVASSAFGLGASIAEVTARTYYFDSASGQLRQYDTDQTDVPLVDDVTEFSVEYMGDAGGTSLAPLPLQVFADGPWIGNGLTRFDADLCRVRQVRVTIGVQASSPAFRSTGAGFRSPGTSRSAWRRVPDFVVQFDVSSRNAAAVS